MQATHSNRTRPQTLCSRISSLFFMPRRREVVIENLPQSIFELGNPECHEAVVLSDKENFKKLQKRLTAVLNKHITPEVCKQILEEQRRGKDNQTTFHISDTMITNDTTKESKIDDLTKNIQKICDHIIYNDPNIISEYNIKFEPMIKIGTNLSDTLHKDNGTLVHNHNITDFDYTIVIPIMNYNLLDSHKHDYTPESTQIIPHQFKKVVSGYDNKMNYRESIFYENASEKEKKFLVSEKLTQGTAIIFHTATEAGSDDDGKSVIHKSPETPLGQLRCMILVKANKKNTTYGSI